MNKHIERASSAIDIICKAVDEMVLLQKLEDLGLTLEQLVDRSTPKKINFIDKHYVFRCPKCNGWQVLYAGTKYCRHCGQALDWSD